MYNVNVIYNAAGKYKDIAREYMFAGMYANAQVLRQMSACLLSILRKIENGEMLTAQEVAVACGYNN